MRLLDGGGRAGQGSSRDGDNSDQIHPVHLENGHLPGDIDHVFVIHTRDDDGVHLDGKSPCPEAFEGLHLPVEEHCRPFAAMQGGFLPHPPVYSASDVRVHGIDGDGDEAHTERFQFLEVGSDIVSVG